MARFYRAIIPIFLIITIWSLFFWRVLTPNLSERLTFQHGDFTLQFLAYRQIAFRQIAQDRFPFFEECLYSGYPFQADPQSQVTYPPVLAMMMIGRGLGWSEYPLRALEWEVMLHVLIAALGMFVFLRNGYALRNMAALFGAIAFGFNGYMTGYAMLQTAVLQTASWLPLILLAVKHLAQTNNWIKHAALLAVFVFFAFTAGHPQTLLFTVYVGAIAFIVWSEYRLKTNLTRAAIASMLTLGLSAIQLIPSLLFMLNSTRASLSFDNAATGFALSDIALFALTGIFNAWQPLYVGIATLVFAALFFRLQWNANLSFQFNRDRWMWLGVGIGALIFSFGANAFGFDLAYLAAPGYRQFQHQERHAIVIVFVLSALGAFGIHSLSEPLSLRSFVRLRSIGRWLLIASLVAFCVMLAIKIFGSAIEPPRPNIDTIASRIALMSLALFGFAALLFWRIRFAHPNSIWAIASLGLLVFDLFTANRFTATQKPTDPFPKSPLLTPILESSSFHTSRIHNHFGLALNAACVNNLNEIGGGSPIVIRDYKTFLERTPEDVLMKLLNVRHTITWRGAVTTHEGKTIPWFLLARDSFEGKQASTYRLDWKPIEVKAVWVVSTLTNVNNIDQVYQRMGEDNFDPLSEAVVLETDAPNVISVPFGKGSADVEGKSNGYMKIIANVDAPGIVVVSEAFHPNWTATINGREFKPFKVNGAMLGIAIPAGASSIELSYRPIDSYIGAGVSLFTFVVILLLRTISRRALSATN